MEWNAPKRKIAERDGAIYKESESKRLRDKDSGDVYICILYSMDQEWAD